MKISNTPDMFIKHEDKFRIRDHHNQNEDYYVGL